jgi:molybdenum cofactor cytidylyltransferase
MLCAVVLAAGASRRMGVQKLTLPIAGQPMIARSVAAFLEAHIDEVLVVVGPKADVLACALQGCPVRWVTNPAPHSEMLESVRCGIQALPESCVGTFIALGDQPMLNPRIVAALVAAFQKGRHGLIVPVQGGRRGHPLLVGAGYFGEILRAHENVGLRGLLQAHPDDVREVEVDEAEILEDVDTPADYARLLSRIRGESGVT